MLKKIKYTIQKARVLANAINHLHIENCKTEQEIVKVISEDGVQFHSYHSKGFTYDLIYRFLSPEIKKVVPKHGCKCLADIILRYQHPHMDILTIPEPAKNRRFYHPNHLDDFSDHPDFNEINEHFSFSTTSSVIDIGANIGFGELSLCRRFPGIQIAAVEADQRAFAILETNISSNQMKDVQLFNRAISDRTEESTFSMGKFQANKLVNEQSSNKNVTTLVANDAAPPDCYY